MYRLHTLAIAGLGIVLSSTALGHVDDPKILDKQPIYTGLGFKAGVPESAALGVSLGFPSSNMQLMSWLTIPEFGAHSSGNDCWGYVSGSGREYAIIGLSDGTGFVEVTDPGNPSIVGVVSGVNSLWRDIKTYQTYAYMVSEGGGGIQVVDLSQIDSGVITELASVTTGGTTTTHNVVINEDSGYLYRTGGGSNGLRIYDLANPAAPVYVTTWADRYVHDAQVVNYVGGPYDGKEIAFVCSGLNGGWDMTGIDIIDVTDKQNLVVMATYEYPAAQYSHQAWLSADRQYLYLNDEQDEDLDGITSTTHILDVSNLSTPSEVATSTNGSNAITHNLYIDGNTMYAANYRSGIRVFDISSALAPVEIAHFDTWLDDDAAEFNGLWSTYPYFPSGTIIGSDLEKGLFVWRLGAADLAFSYPSGRPALIAPAGEAMSVDIAPASGISIASGTETLHYDDGTGGGYVQVALAPTGGTLYDASFPSLACGADVSYYLSGQTTTGITWRDPQGAPGDVYGATVASSIAQLVNDDYESDSGYAPANLGATSGDWVRGVPVNDGGWAYDPTSDSDGSGQCWLTQNALGNTDIDGGAVELVTSDYDLSGGSVLISYDYFLRLTSSDGTDKLLVEISSNGGAGPWTEVARHDTDGGLSWRSHTIDQPTLDSAGVTMTSTMRLRFTANDGDPQSIVEAGLDALDIDSVLCGVLGDATGDGFVDVADLLAILAAWGPCPGCPEDVAGGDGIVDVADLLLALAEWS